MHAVSQMIERNLHRRGTCACALWINPEKDDCWQQVKTSCSSLKLFSQDYGSFAFLQEVGADTEFAAFPQISDEKYEWIIVNLPRQKALLGMLLDCAASLLSEDGVLWLAGENQAGIKSANRLLDLNFKQVRKLDNARHCVLYEAREVMDQQSFNPLNYRQKWTLDCKPSKINIASYPGAFAHGRLDAGTELFLETLADMKLEGDVLDFACGTGVIGAYIAANHPHTRITFTDTSALALRACEETLAANHLDGTVLASDGLSEVGGGFDIIVSNPPIHAGIKTDNRLSLGLLESVHEFINAGGMLVMVANIHLPYEAWLSERFRHSRELASNNNYKVIAARK